MKHPASYISDNLLLAVALAFVAGIAVSPVVALSVAFEFSFRAALFSTFFLLAVLHLLGKPKTLFCLLMPMTMAIGAYHGYLALQLPADNSHVYHRVNDQADVVLIGTMSTMAEFDGRTSQTIIEAMSIRTRENADLLPTNGKILLRLQGSWPSELSPGDRLVIRTDLRRPDSFRTPGVFDYAQYLARSDIWITGFVRSPLFLHKLEVNQSFLHTLRYLPEKLRTEIGRQIDAAVSPDKSGLYRAILLGDRSHVDEDTLETFKGSGTMHILAISGMHMAVIGTLLYAGLFWIFSRSEKLLLHFSIKKWAAFFSLPVLVCYGLLAGMNTPVFRAVIMSSIIIIAICTNRRKSPGALLAAAAMLILIVDPLQLFMVSFQLSFAAITGIFFLWPILQNFLFGATASRASVSCARRALNWLIAGLAVSLVANLATAPIALYAFNRFSIVGPVANLLIEPLICLWGLAAGFIAIPFMFIQPETASFFLQAGALGIEAAMQTAHFLSSFSFSTIWLPTPPLWLIFSYYFALIVFASSFREMKWPSLLSGASLALCILLFSHPLQQHNSRGTGSLQITYLDVGQGTATLLTYPSGYTVLIDGGGSSFATTTIGERVLAPFLWHKGLQKIDAIAITHPDADHYNGLDFIIEHFSPKILWVRDKHGHDDNYKRLLQLAEERGLSVTVPQDGDNLLDGAESLECIANTADREHNDGDDMSRDHGNSGLILKACADQFCALFPGDIGRDEEQSLVLQGYNLQADVLLAAHHGSITSNSSRFLAAAAPKYLLVSAGRSPKNHFPHQGLATDCAVQGIDLITTAEQGTLEMISQQGGCQLYGYAKRDANPLSSYHPVMLDERRITPQ